MLISGFLNYFGVLTRISSKDDLISGKGRVQKAPRDSGYFCVHSNICWFSLRASGGACELPFRKEIPGAEMLMMEKS